MASFSPLVIGAAWDEGVAGQAGNILAALFMASALLFPSVLYIRWSKTGVLPTWATEWYWRLPEGPSPLLPRGQKEMENNRSIFRFFGSGSLEPLLSERLRSEQVTDMVGLKKSSIFHSR